MRGSAGSPPRRAAPASGAADDEAATLLRPIPTVARVAWYQPLPAGGSARSWTASWVGAAALLAMCAFAAFVAASIGGGAGEMLPSSPASATTANAANAYNYDGFIPSASSSPSSFSSSSSSSGVSGSGSFAPTPLMSWPAPHVLYPRTAARATAAVVMLHGLGGGAEGWWKGFATAVRAKRAYSRDNLDAVKWVFPNAPSRPITLRHGLAEPAWYDMKTIPKYDVTKMWHDRKGILESAQHVKEVIQQLVREGIAPQRIVVGGFSQGGAIALTTTLHAAGVPLGGCFALSSYLPMAYDMYVGNLEVLPSALEVPFYLAHGTEDAVLPYSFAVKTRQELDTLGAKFVKMDTIEGLGHDLSDEELGLLADFIANVIASHPIEKGVGKREKEVEEVAAGGRGGGGGGGGGGGPSGAKAGAGAGAGASGAGAGASGAGAGKKPPPGAPGWRGKGTAVAGGEKGKGTGEWWKTHPAWRGRGTRR